MNSTTILALTILLIGCDAATDGSHRVPLNHLRYAVNHQTFDDYLFRGRVLHQPSGVNSRRLELDTLRRLAWYTVAATSSSDSLPDTVLYSLVWSRLTGRITLRDEARRVVASDSVDRVHFGLTLFLNDATVRHVGFDSSMTMDDLLDAAVGWEAPLELGPFWSFERHGRGKSGGRLRLPQPGAVLPESRSYGRGTVLESGWEKSAWIDLFGRIPQIVPIG